MTEPSMQQDDTPITASQAATYTGLKEGTIRNLVQRREIPFLKPGGALRFRRSELDEWMKKRAGRKEVES